MKGNAYVLITPVRNEEAHLEKTINSVAAQTLLPMEWVLVNDGSSDRTPGILETAAVEHPWIQVIHRPDRGFRKAGGGVMEAFHDGYARIRAKDWDFLGKLDGDLSFDLDYFVSCLACFHTDPRLGIGGGLICKHVDGTVVEESKGDPLFHVRGATKIYRRACWDTIGGLIQAPGWDTLDELKANMLGWTTRSFPNLKMIHHRPTGAADGVWRNWFKNGRANYVVGYHPAFMLAKCLKRLSQKPYGIVSLALWYGFVSGYTSRIPQAQDKDIIRYVRRQQMNRLLWRKSIWV